MLQPFKSLDDFILCFVQGFPKGKLYSYAKTPTSNFFKFFKGLLSPYYNWLIYTQKAIQDLIINYNEVGIDNIWLDKFIIEYGLLQYGIFNLQSAQDKLKAIKIFLKVRKLVTKQDIIDFFNELGYTVTITNGTEHAGYFGYSYFDYSYFDFNRLSAFVVYITVQAQYSLTNDNALFDYSYFDDGHFSSEPKDLFFAKIILQKLFPCYIYPIITLL